MNGKSTKRSTNRNASSSRSREINTTVAENKNPSTEETSRNLPRNMNNIVKTSTPNKDGTPCDLNVSNVSNISFVRSSTSSTPFVRPRPPSSAGQGNTTIKKKTPKKQSKVTPSDDNLALMQYNAMLQSIILNKILGTNTKKTEDEMDKELAALKADITEKQEILNKTKERIRKITALSEQQALIDQHKNDIKNAADIINKFNTSYNPQHSKAVMKELERMRNKLAIENIAIPENTSNLKFHETLKNSLSSYEKLNKETLVNADETKEMKDSLTQFEKCQREIDEIYKSCSDRMPAIASSVLKNCSNKVNKVENEDESDK